VILRQFSHILSILGVYGFNRPAFHYKLRGTIINRKGGVAMKIKDRILLAAVAGTVANAAASVIDRGTTKFGLNQRTWSQRDKNLVVSNNYEKSKAADFAGAMVKELLSVLGAVPLVYAHTATGKDKSLVKGMMYGGLTWIDYMD
jgi:hypothetical protein